MKSLQIRFIPFPQERDAAPNETNCLRKERQQNENLFCALCAEQLFQTPLLRKCNLKNCTKIASEWDNDAGGNEMCTLDLFDVSFLSLVHTAVKTRQN